VEERRYHNGDLYIPKNSLVNKEYARCNEPAYQEKYNKYSIQELVDKIAEQEKKQSGWPALYYLKENWTLVLGRSLR
jgi:hypothetical protein